MTILGWHRLEDGSFAFHLHYSLERLNDTSKQTLKITIFNKQSVVAITSLKLILQGGSGRDLPVHFTCALLLF